MPRAEDAKELAEVKGWLAGLLETSQLSKTQLAREIGVEPKTVYNAFSPKASLPHGLAFYRLLRELDALREAAPAGPSLSERLAALEGRVDRMPTKVDLQRGLDAVREAIAAQASRDTQQDPAAEDRKP